MTDTDAATAISDNTNMEGYENPNQSYPHPSSLRSPTSVLGVPTGNNHIEEYVDLHTGQLRVMSDHAHDGMKEALEIMLDWLVGHKQEIMEFVDRYGLTSDDYKGDGTGIGYKQKCHVNDKVVEAIDIWLRAPFGASVACQFWAGRARRDNGCRTHFGDLVPVPSGR